MTNTTSSWLALHRPNPQAHLRLFCFPYAGGGASTYREWQVRLPATVEVCPVQLPGHETRLRETPFQDLEPLIEAAGTALVPLLDRPFAFYGHSLGALLCFELMRWLRRYGHPLPCHLLVSGQRGPAMISGIFPQQVLSDDEFIQMLHNLDGTNKAVLENEQLMRLFLPLLRADFSVHDNYNYYSEPPFDCSITAFGGQQDANVSEPALLNWREQTRRAFTYHILPGGHFFINSASNELLGLISNYLNELIGALSGVAND